MTRTLLVAPLVALALAAPVDAKRIRMFTPTEKALRADAVVVGKVTAIEKEPTAVPGAPGEPGARSYRVAVVKVETGLIGAANVTHVKIGFEPVAPDAPRRSGPGPFVPTEGTEALFFLTKHPAGDFYTVSPMLSPTDTTALDYKDQIALVKRAAAVLTDPVKALKADRADDRSFAANMLVNKYRAYPESGGEVENIKVPADESRLVLKTLAESDWKPAPNAPDTLNPYRTFGLLGLNNQDGWTPPATKPGEDIVAATKEAFVKWLDGPGKGYQIRAFALKKPGK